MAITRPTECSGAYVNNLEGYSLRVGRPSEAEAPLARAIEQFDILSKQEPDRVEYLVSAAAALVNLAGLRWAATDPSFARDGYDRCVATFEKVLQRGAETFRNAQRTCFDLPIPWWHPFQTPAIFRGPVGPSSRWCWSRVRLETKFDSRRTGPRYIGPSRPALVLSRRTEQLSIKSIRANVLQSRVPRGALCRRDQVRRKT